MKMPATPEGMTGRHSRNNTKLSRILGLFVAGRTLNRFEAEPLGDHCLNSTVSTLANSHGLTFTRMPEKVPNRFGSKTHCMRYSLPESERGKARALLARLERRNPRQGVL